MRRAELEVRYKEYLALKNYRPSTKYSYVKSIQYYFDFSIKNKDKYQSASAFAKAFLLDRFSQGYSWCSVNIYYSALVILFKQILNEKWDYDLVPRPRGYRRLPTILSTIQIECMINNTRNFKHKTILIIFYSTGVRISELINIEVSDVLIDRKQLKINMGKGGRDRIIHLPELTIEILKLYMINYSPKKYLIEGISKTKRYSQSSINKIISKASKTSGILINVTAHSFRYAYATHHIENGTDLVTLQMQLGHKNVETTIKYINLCQLQDRHLNHPIDQLHIELSPPTRWAL